MRVPLDRTSTNINMASKYQNGALFCPQYSRLSPPTTDLAMARSSSRESTTSISHYQFNVTSAYSMCRSSSSQSTTRSAPTSSPMRRSSSSSSSNASTWLASPYRSCLNTSFEEASSYLSDDDLLCLNIPVESIPNPERQRKQEMTTEEQVEHLRQLQEEEEEREQQSRRSSSIHSSKKTVRFEEISRKPRRPSQLKRRSTAVRRGLSNLNGPM